MSWPLKMRLLSFGIGTVVVMGEFALVAVPVGVVLWLAGVGSALHLAESLAAIALAFALVVIIPVHIRPTPTDAIAKNGGTR